MAALNPGNLSSWLLKNRELLNLSGIANAAGISPVTFRAFVNGDRNLSEKSTEQVLALLNDMRSKL